MALLLQQLEQLRNNYGLVSYLSLSDSWASQVALAVKNSPANAGNIRLGFDPWVGRSPGGGYGNPVQYSCLKNLHGAWCAAVHGVTLSWTQLKQLSRHAPMSFS